MSKTLIISGSNSSKSINKEVAKQLAKKTGYELVDLVDYDIPFYCFDREQRGFCEDLKKLEAKVAEANTLIFCLPEHNGNFPAFAKSCIDWLSRKKDVYPKGVLAERKVYLITASPGAAGGQSIREIFTNLMPWLGTTVIGTHGIGSYASGMDISAHLDSILKDLK